MASQTYLGGRVVVATGDITKIAVDAIVNAANSALMGGGGVDGEIHARGGSAITAACGELRRTRYPDGLPVGEAVLTTAGKLPARFVVHTVGPIWGADKPADRLLASCYRKAIELVDAEGLESISFPAISTGAYGYPKDKAAAVVSKAIAEALGNAHTVRKVHLVFFSDADRDTFVRHQQFP
jgi:O-acetyl-ADP-ribose deacetylase (regulator of RNase III)